MKLKTAHSVLLNPRRLTTVTTYLAPSSKTTLYVRLLGNYTSSESVSNDGFEIMLAYRLWFSHERLLSRTRTLSLTLLKLERIWLIHRKQID